MTETSSANPWAYLDTYLRDAVRIFFSRKNPDYAVRRVLDVLPQSVKDLRLTMVPVEAACDYA